MKSKYILWLLLPLLFVENSYGYPIDGYAVSFISRLIYEQNVQKNPDVNSKLKPGALRSISEIQLLLTNTDAPKVKSIPEKDVALQKEVERLFYGLDPNYSLAVLDISPGRTPRYAAHRENVGYQPGSVGKLAVLNAFFHELNNIYPGDFERMQEVMRTKVVRSGSWGIPNSHTIPIYDIKTAKIVKRYVQENDEFTLYEWLDHMMSVSSNAAASICWREALLMRAFKEEYECLTEYEVNQWLKVMPRDSLSDMSIAVVHDPLRQMGIDSTEWRLGTMFTRGASNIVPPQGGSIGTPKALLKFLLALENGVIVNEEVSLEMKRLMYLTDRRIRYAAATVLDEAAVCFKSGSLYSCQSEPGYKCVKYAGNRFNYMNSVAIIEQPDCSIYMVALMSNVLKKNSAGDHLGLATRIDRLVREGEETD